MRKVKTLTYSQVGDNYDTKDPIKKLALGAARQTSANLKKAGFEAIEDTRGESAFVWNPSTGSGQGKDGFYLASVIEGLGTKNLIADSMYKLTGKSYYEVIGHDTVATIVNDLISVGARPLVVHAYWAIEDNNWLQDEKRMADLIGGWKDACNLSGATWGGGETATLKDIITPGTVDLGGSAIGIITSDKRRMADTKLQPGDRILLLKSNGINANGISLARAVAKRLPSGFGTRMRNSKTFGEEVLTKTHIYAKLVQDLLDGAVDIHYITNITGHGLRKIMRARGNFTYVIKKLFDPQEVFLFIQKEASLSDYEMYQTFNMGQDYAIFTASKDVKKAQEIIKKNGFTSIDAGFVQEGERQVILEPKGLTYKSETLDLR